MSVPATVLGNALQTPVGQLLSLIPSGSIGGISVQATLEEIYTDTLEVTEHPVEAGAQITDHSYVRPQQLIMRCGWSNSASSALQGQLQASLAAISPQLAAVAAALGTVSGLVNGNVLTGSYVAQVYQQLLSLQQSRQPFSVVATARQYTNMLLTELTLRRDKTNSQALMVTARMRQVIMVSSQTTTLPATANQRTPASTAETTNIGTLQPAAVDVSALQGALPAANWPASL